MSEQRTTILVTKPHFQVLDGLRGVAALAIVVFHFMEWIYTDGNLNFIGHGFLAVDFFFCLSGFVIAYAYDDRIGEMELKQFFISRLIRLHPLVVFGSVLGLLGLLLDPFSGPEEMYSPGHVAWIFFCSIMLIPLPVMPSRAFNLFGLNAPSWSLFWEYIANIIYATVLHRFNKKLLLLLTVVAGALLFNVNVRAGNLLGGWAGNNFWDGCARIFYSFLAGMVIFRFRWMIPNRLGFAGLSALLLLAFLMPYSSANWWTESAIVIIYFPLIVSLGAGARLSRMLEGICVFSGKISYPLYMTHYGWLWIFGHYLYTVKPPSTQLPYIVSIGTILLVGFAYLTMVVYDIPVRKYLTKIRLKKY